MPLTLSRGPLRTQAQEPHLRETSSPYRGSLEVGAPTHMGILAEIETRALTPIKGPAVDADTGTLTPMWYTDI